jgi:acetyl-CoA C-acetyltransferase
MPNPYARARFAGLAENPRRKATGIHPFQILSEVIHAALDDAGLTLADVDGLAVTAGDMGEGGQIEDIIEVAEHLRITPRWVDSKDIGGCSGIVQAAHAAAAISVGLCDVVVVAYAACPKTFTFYPPTALTWPIGPGAHEMPHGLSNITAYALFAQAHMHRYGMRPEHLAGVSVTARAHAALNPQALFRDPITVDDVLAAPRVSTPFGKLDCCVVTESGAAVVLVSAERARDLRRPGQRILGHAEVVTRVSLNQVADFTQGPGSLTGPRAFAMAGLTPAQLDVAQLYDAFSITPLIALEDLGIVGRGEAGPFIAEGGLSATGTLPFNTDGGGLSSNHPGKRGLFVLIEALRQLRGDSPGLNVPDVEVSLAHGIGGFFSAAATMLLGRD